MQTGHMCNGSCLHTESMPEWARELVEGESIYIVGWMLAEQEFDRVRHEQEQAERAAEEAEREFEADVRDRLRGRCDLCFELPREREQLEIDGGLALCSGCCTRGEDP